jgi:AraC-like DNA-binding protein
MREMITAFAQRPEGTRTGRGGRVDDRHVALTCIEYASSIDRIPSMSELCMVAQVCERRLRLAFNRTFDLPPTHFFQAWAMDQARRKLLAAEPGGETVTTVAAGLGFAHLARFAGRYRARYGEAPSQTLRRRV